MNKNLEERLSAAFEQDAADDAKYAALTKEQEVLTVRMIEVEKELNALNWRPSIDRPSRTYAIFMDWFKAKKRESEKGVSREKTAG